MNNEEREQMVDRVAQELGEHFDAVNISVSWMDRGTTKGFTRGQGNWYARQGMAHQFINTDIAMEQANRISNALNHKE